MANSTDKTENPVIYYKSSTDFEYLWHNGVFVKIQDTTDKLFRQKPYALVYSQNTFDSEETLNALIERKVTQQMSIEFFKERLKRAFEIIENNVNLKE